MYMYMYAFIDQKLRKSPCMKTQINVAILVYSSLVIVYTKLIWGVHDGYGSW